MTWRFWIRFLLVLAVLAGGIVAGLYFLRPIASVVPVTRGIARDAVAGTLTVKAVPFPLVAEVGGRIAESSLELGRVVTAGEVLIQLDAAAITLEIDDLKSRLEALRRQREIGSTRKFELEAAQYQLSVARANMESNVGSQSDVDARQRDVKRIEQAIELESLGLDQQAASLENQIKSKELIRSKMTLRASTDGTVTKINAYVDYLVNAGTAIAEIVSAKRMVEAKISEENFDKIKVGQAATVRLSGYGDHPFSGKVTLTLPAADTETQRYLIHVDVDIENDKLLPGMTGDVLVFVAERPDALLVPRTAVNGGHVFVVSDGKAVHRKVEIGFEDLNEAEILSGLTEGDLVIVDELDRFEDGSSVRVELKAKK